MKLTTTYLGLQLKSPLMPSAAAPLTEDLDNIRRLEDAGASAIVLHSLFQEQLMANQGLFHHHPPENNASYAETLGYLSEASNFYMRPELYLGHLTKAKAAVGIPVIASLNGHSAGSWVEFACLLQVAGADAIELNWYTVPADLNRTGAEMERELIETVLAVKQAVSIPVAVKLSPYFSNFANIAKQLDDARADGLVMFNRFMQPDINTESLEVLTVPYLSSVNDLRLPLRWIAMLHGRLRCDMAASSGIRRGVDVVKLLMVGAKVTQVCSSLLRHGIDRLRIIEQELRDWLDIHDYESIAQLQGRMSQRQCANPGAYERAQYIKTVQSYRPAPLRPNYLRYPFDGSLEGSSQSAQP